VLASCAPRPDVGAGERRARPSSSGGVGCADAALKALALRAAKTGARASALLASLRCLSNAPRAPSRQRDRELPGAAKESSRAVLLAELLLHARPPRQTTSATEADEANDFCHLLVNVTKLVTVVTKNAADADVLGCAPVLGCQDTALRASRYARP